MDRKDLDIINSDFHDAQYDGAVVKPIFQNSLFTFKDYETYQEKSQDELNNFIYTRGKNPTVYELEKKIADLERGDIAKCFASGMAAISASIMACVKAGDHIIYFDQVYGPTQQLITSYLPKFNVEYTVVNGNDIEELKKAIKPNTSLIYLESPSSIFFEVYDISKIAEIAKANNIKTIIDNTWATSLYQKPLTFGIDLVVHSLTKYVGGHSDVVAGVVIGNENIMTELFKSEFMLFGGIMAPLTANLCTRGLRTLHVRLKEHEENAREVAKALSKLQWIKRINYPGLESNEYHEMSKKYMTGYSGLISIEGDFTREESIAIANNLKHFRIGVSWGGFDSLALPLLSQKRKTEEPTVAIRLQIGLENVETLIEDLYNAFNKVMNV